jgi:hypothetical protein
MAKGKRPGATAGKHEECMSQVTDAAVRAGEAPWRQGRSNPRLVYARTGGADWKADELIGVFFVPEYAARVCQEHNGLVYARTGGAARVCQEHNGAVR